MGAGKEVGKGKGGLGGGRFESLLLCFWFVIWSVGKGFPTGDFEPEILGIIWLMLN